MGQWLDGWQGGSADRLVGGWQSMNGRGGWWMGARFFTPEAGAQGESPVAPQ